MGRVQGRDYSLRLHYPYLSTVTQAAMKQAQEKRDIETNVNACEGDVTNVNTGGVVTNVNAGGGEVTNVNASKGDVTNVNTSGGEVTNVNASEGDVMNVNTSGVVTNVNTGRGDANTKKSRNKSRKQTAKSTEPKQRVIIWACT